MATNLVFAAGTDPNIDENRYYMIWQSILNNQFRIDKWYGVGFETSLTSAGTKRDLFIVKALGAQEHVVLVADIKKPLEETEEGKEHVIKELVDYIEEQFDHDETKFPSIYGLAGIGLTWTVFRLDRKKATDSSPLQPQILVPWRSNISSAWACGALEEVVSEIDKMKTSRESIMT